MGVLLIIFTAVFVLGPIARAVARRIERDAPPLEPASAAEIGRLREDVERLSSEVSRLHEEQTFIVTLLSEGERKQLGKGPEPDS